MILVSSLLGSVPAILGGAVDSAPSYFLLRKRWFIRKRPVLIAVGMKKVRGLVECMERKNVLAEMPIVAHIMMEIKETNE